MKYRAHDPLSSETIVHADEAHGFEVWYWSNGGRMRLVVKGKRVSTRNVRSSSDLTPGEYIKWFNKWKKNANHQIHALEERINTLRMEQQEIKYVLK